MKVHVVKEKHSGKIIGTWFNENKALQQAKLEGKEKIIETSDVADAMDERQRIATLEQSLRVALDAKAKLFTEKQKLWEEIKELRINALLHQANEQFYETATHRYNSLLEKGKELLGIDLGALYCVEEAEIVDENGYKLSVVQRETHNKQHIIVLRRAVK